MPLPESMWTTQSVLETCALMRKNMLEQIVGNIDTELLREQRNYLIKLANEKDHGGMIDGTINLLDNLLDILDLHTGA